MKGRKNSNGMLRSQLNKSRKQALTLEWKWVRMILKATSKGELIRN